MPADQTGPSTVIGQKTMSGRNYLPLRCLEGGRRVLVQGYLCSPWALLSLVVLALLQKKDHRHVRSPQAPTSSMIACQWVSSNHLVPIWSPSIVPGVPISCDDVLKPSCPPSLSGTATRIAAESALWFCRPEFRAPKERTRFSKWRTLSAMSPE